LVPQAAQGINTFTDAINAIFSGNAYVNVHTVTNPTGEIRGQLAGVLAPTATAPVADVFAWIGNTPLISTAPNAPSVLANDPPGSTIRSSSTTSTAGNLVAVKPNGTFDFTPAFGFKGTDTFTYTVTGFAPTTVTVQVDSLAWYVDTTVAAGGNGSFGNSFAALADAFTAAAPGDTIFVFADGVNVVNAGLPITLAAGQKLVGEGTAFTFPVLPGAPVEILPASALGERPVISDAAAAVASPVVTLANNSEVSGFQLVSGNAVAESGAVLGIGVSNVFVRDNLIPNAAGVGINLQDVSGTGDISGNEITNSGNDGISISMASAVPLTARLTVTGNTVTGSGGLGGGIIAEISLANQLTMVLSQNQVLNNVGESGVFMLSDDTSAFAALVDGNVFQDNQGAVGILDFGIRSRGTSTFCLELTNNVSNSVLAGVNDVAFLIENTGGVVNLFQSNNTGLLQMAGAITPVAAGACGTP
jgi:hypothetical protein